MYEFVDIDELPISREMSIQTILGGVNLDYTVKGFTTLAVHGRELIGRKISTQDFNSMGKSKTKNVGSATNTNKFLGSALQSRSIEVEFMLKADNNRDFREVCERLNYILHNEEMTIQFTDDKEYEYIGTVSNIKEINAVTNCIVSSFILECSEPFKISVKDKLFKFEKDGIFNYKTLYPAIFSRIVIKVKNNTNVMKLHNLTTAESIILNDDFTTGDIIIINNEENIITKNNKDIFNKLALISDLETFNASFNDELMTNINSSVEIYFKERRL